MKYIIKNYNKIIYNNMYYIGWEALFMNKEDKIFKEKMIKILEEGTKDEGTRPYYPSDN